MSKQFKGEVLLPLWDSIKAIEALSHPNREDAIKLPIRFSHALVRNKKRLEEFGLGAEELRREPEWVASFRLEIEEVNKKFADKTEKGAPKIEGGRYIITGENEGNAAKARAVIVEKYKEQSDARDAELKEYEEELKTEPVEFEPFLVDFDHVPDLPLGIIEALDIIIREPAD